LVGVEFAGSDNLEVEIYFLHIIERQIFSGFVADQIAHLSLFHGGKIDFLDDDGMTGQRRHNVLAAATGLFEKVLDARYKLFVLDRNAFRDDAFLQGQLRKATEDIFACLSLDLGEFQRTGTYIQTYQLLASRKQIFPVEHGSPPIVPVFRQPDLWSKPVYDVPFFHHPQFVPRHSLDIRKIFSEENDPLPQFRIL